MRLGIDVDLGVVRRNVAAVRALTGTRLLLMVKADAYGHGMKNVAAALARDVDYFGVATLEEGEELRKSGVSTPVLVAICPPEGLARAAKNSLTAAVADLHSLRALAAMREEERPSFHVKIDTGMHRLGFAAKDVPELIRYMLGEGLRPEGVYSHFRMPDAGQSAVFDGAAEAFSAAFPGVTAHMASSSSLGMKGAARDMVRIGHAAYVGAMSVHSRVIAVREAAAGECVGYGCCRLKHDALLAVVFGGYFDGVYAERPSPVLLRGKVCPVVGRVCMDMFTVDATGTGAGLGDEVILLGGELTCGRVASARSTSEYEVMTCWQGRSERTYRDEKGSQSESERCGGANERRREGMGVGCDNRRAHLA